LFEYHYLLQYSHSIDEAEGGASSWRCYLTITAVPSLDGCKACYQVATSYEDDGMIIWN